MTACTDDERREVAARLREFSKDRWSLTVGGNSATIRYAISDIVFGDKKYHSGVDLLDRLADLIEPPRQCPCYDSGRHRCSIHDVPTIDREALLALADEMEAGPRRERCPVALDCSECAGHCSERLSEHYARRIREACGEVA